MTSTTIYRATGHCSGVELELDLPVGSEDLRGCNCSLCRRRGTIVASVPLSGLKVVRGRELLTRYQFNTRKARHYFCSNCGIYTHHQRLSSPDQIDFNVACLEGADVIEFNDIAVADGVNRPCDRRTQ